MSLDSIVEILFKGILIPIIPLIVVYLKELINAKTNEISNKVESETVTKYLEIAKNTLQSCVTETTQIYVDVLKEQGKFDKEAQIIAMELTRETFLSIISESTKEVLEEMFDDYNIWITTSIEEIINNQKK